MHKVSYQREFLDPLAADTLLAELWQRVPWRRERLRMFGREVAVPRRVAWCGEPGLSYRYSGSDHAAAGWLPPLKAIAGRLEAELGGVFNFVLLNAYADGSEYMGWHTDAEPEMVGAVASLSLGGPRRFLLRPDDASRSIPIELEHGSLLVFDPAIRHSLPRCASAERRVNLTFRHISRGDAP